MTETGWVYVITNESMPGLVKVGVTAKRPEKRAKELDETGSPTPYKVETAFLFSEGAEQIEKKAHTLLSNIRVRGNREWFRCSAHLAAENVLIAADQVGQVARATNPILISPEEIAAREEQKRKRVEVLAKEKEKRRLQVEEEKRWKQEQERRRKEFDKIFQENCSLFLKAFRGDFESILLIYYYFSSNGELIRFTPSTNTIDQHNRDYYKWEYMSVLKTETWKNFDHIRFQKYISIEPVIVFNHFSSLVEQNKGFQICLGYCYAEGYGVEANPEVAFYWFNQAQLDDKKLRALAYCYLHGFGVKRNRRKGKKFLKKYRDFESKLLYSF